MGKRERTKDAYRYSKLQKPTFRALLVTKAMNIHVSDYEQELTQAPAKD